MSPAENKKAEAVGYGKIVGFGTLATVVAGAGSEFLNGEMVDIITRVGLPMVLLAVVVKYSMNVIALKDAEIKRLNEARIRDTLHHAERLYKVTTATHKLASENNTTLDTVSRSNQ